MEPVLSPLSANSPDPARVLGLFAKWPEPGRVKSRLAARTSPGWAAAVAAAFLQDIVDRFSRLPARRVLAFAPRGSEPAFAALSGGRFGLAPQADGDLGTRLAEFARGEFEHGAGRVVLLGTDSPTLPVEFVSRAFEILATSDVVLGPAADGGYYLIGCRGFTPALFQGIAWGGEHVLGQTVDRVREASLSLALLPPWYDVDTLEDWHMLCGHVAALRLAGIDPGLPRTEQLIRESPPSG